MKKMKAQFGFTIAELLVAMMLISGIAMLMMPSLMADNEKQLLATTLKKVYSQLQQTSQSVSLLQARGTIPPNEEGIVAFAHAFGETTKLLPAAKENELLANYDINGYDYNTNNAIGADIDDIMVTKSGIFFFFKYDEDDTFGETAPNLIIVDVNGRKAPNTIGRDVFLFRVDVDYSDFGKNLVVAPFEANCPEPKDKKSKGYCSEDVENCAGCAHRILIGDGNGKIDYF